MQVVLLAIVTFIFAIDQFSLTEVIYRPIIACTIIGLILGDLKTGLAIGGTYELMMIGNMPVGGAQPPNAVLGSAFAMVFAVKSGLGVNEALGAVIPFTVVGQYAVTLTFTAMSVFMVKADHAAENANPKGIAQVNYISMAILGSIFALAAVAAFYAAEPLKGGVEWVKGNLSFVMGGLSAAGGMMRYVGFAVLMKIMLADDMWGIYFAGFAAAALFGNVEAVKGATLLLVAFVGIAIAIYDYSINVKFKSSNGGNGGVSDGI